MNTLRNAYRSPARGSIRLEVLERILGRHKTNICRKARELGLTDPKRPGKAQTTLRFPTASTVPSEERRRRIGEHTRKWIAENGHPRGALGLKHTDKVKATISVQSRQRWADPASALNSPASRQRRSDLMYERMRAGTMGRGYSRAKSGRRADLADTYFRSAWEANYARFLNLLIARSVVTSWEYEPKTFVFETIKRGNRSYTPDFRVTFPDGRIEWHEVKGWMDDKSRVRIERLRKFYPEEVLMIIDAAWFKQAARGIAYMIPGWE